MLQSVSPRLLTIPEQVLLLNTWMTSRLTGCRKRDLYWVDEALAAGRLIELVLATRITVESGRRHLLWRDEVVLVETTPTGDALLDEVVQRVAAAKVRSCAHWIKRVAKGSRDAYWDRLASKSLLRRDALRGDTGRCVADADAVATATDRIRAVLAHPEAADLRDVALVTLLAHTQSLFGILHDLKPTPAGLIRAHRAQRRDDRLGRLAMDNHARNAEADARLSPHQRDGLMATAHAVARITRAAETVAAGNRGSGPG